MNLQELLKGVPSTLQYVAVLGVVMVILYVCLTLTRIIGQKHGPKETYDDPEKYAESVPDLFATTAFRKKKYEQPKDE